MPNFAHLKSCADVGDPDFARAAADRESFGNLMSRLAELASAGNGAVKVLLACSRVVKDQPAWTDGLLRLKLSAIAEGTKVEVMSEQEGFVEPLFPPFVFKVQLSEFSTIADRTPHLLFPLLVVWSTPTKLTLTGEDRKGGTIAGPLSAHADSTPKPKT